MTNLSSFISSIRQRQLATVDDTEAARLQAQRNVGAFERDISCLLRVSKKNDLIGIVEEANRWHVPLYPYSCGLNWGYGSGLPVKNGCALLDLSHLNRIIKIDEDHGIATIEPGVTQKELADELERRGSRYYLDVTGSGEKTSVLGNTLERGIAYGSLRVQQLTGMEVLLGNGKKFRTGFGGFSNPALAGLYQYGLGPALDGLFFQSNFGIVLEGDIQLTLRPERLLGLTISLKSENILVFVDQIRELLRQGYLRGIPHLADRERTLSTMAPLIAEKAGLATTEARKLADQVLRDDWMLTTAVAGSAAVVAENLKHIEKVLRPLGRIYAHPLTRPLWKDRLKSWFLKQILSSKQRMIIQATEPLRAFHQGTPSNAGIQFLLKDSNISVDESSDGFLLCTPLAPLSGKSALLFIQIAEEQAAKYQVRFAMTLNMLTVRVLEAVISVHFARTSHEERTNAHAFVNELTEVFSKKGFYPYRINIDQQARLSSWSPALAETVICIKNALDPNGIIAPGRYDFR